MEKLSPEISIIIPAFNEEKNITRCLDSIINGTFQNFEIIFIDDGSTDNTFDTVKAYAEKNNKIKIFKNIGKGVSEARNFGMTKAQGKYIGFVDSDDFIEPQMYEFLYRAVKENNSEMAVCRYRKTSELSFNTFDYTARECSAEEFIDFYNNDFVLEHELTVTSACMKLIKRELLEKCGTFLKYRIGEDTVFCADLWVNTEKVFLVDLPLYCYYENNESSTHQLEPWHEKWFDLLETRFISYEIFRKYKTSLISSFYLDRGMKAILSYRLSLKGSPNEQRFKKDIKKYFRKYISSYIKCGDIGLKYRIAVPVLYIFPPLYKAFRKMTDSTL